MKKFTFLDLFCGCGGFTLGMQRAGFRCLASVDFNEEAVSVFKENFPDVPHALNRDLTKFSPEELGKLLVSEKPDVIVGGPPCQGFSTARQVDGANHGERLKDDPRRHLYREFLRHVEFFQPKVFVMENVLGIRSASGGEYFTRVQAEARKLGYRVTARTWEQERGVVHAFSFDPFGHDPSRRFGQRRGSFLASLAQAADKRNVSR